jgi:SAM-dependent methyltransferase
MGTWVRLSNGYARAVHAKIGCLIEVRENEFRISAVDRLTAYGFWKSNTQIGLHACRVTFFERNRKLASMTLPRRAYQRILGQPFVYKKVRPFLLGGINYAPAYAAAGVTEVDRILDIGCGMGDALNHNSRFEAYLGLDIDPVALDAAREAFGHDPRVTFEQSAPTPERIAAFGPTCAFLGGVLHHLPDEEARAVLRTLAQTRRLTRVLTHDPVYLPHEWISNFLAFMDRGRHCRSLAGYRALAEATGFAVAVDRVASYNPDGGLGKYYCMLLRRAN